MKFLLNRYSLLFSFCVFIAINGITQEETAGPRERTVHQLDSATYRKLVKELDWSQTKKVLRPREFEKQEKEPTDKSKQRSIGLGGPAFQILGYGAVIILIGFILYLILDKIKVNPRLEKEEFESIPLDQVEDIQVIDARRRLEDALQQGNYREALAMHYILILQTLASDDKIIWEPSKTNRDYNREMRKNPNGQRFSIISGAYDLSLYGDRPFGKEQYQALLPDLELFALLLQPVTHG